MKRSRKMESNSNLRRCLALMLAVALGLGATAATAAAPPDHASGPHQFPGLDLHQVPAEVLAPFADVLAAQAQPHQTTGGTITVQNCNGTGTGSLRAAVAGAASGDTIDLSHLGCTYIELWGEIPVPLASLTIKGKPGSGGGHPSPSIHAVTGRIFNHSGTGTLTLKDLYLNNGHISSGDGGCVYSNGKVVIDATHITVCGATNTAANSMARGGGVFAAGNIELHAGSRIEDNTVRATRNAYGGGLYTDKLLLIYGDPQLDNAFVANNTATVTGNGYARGGGLFAEKSIIGGQLGLYLNKVEGTASQAAAITGGGAFTRDTALIGSMHAWGNSAEGQDSQGGALYITKAATVLDSLIFLNYATGTDNKGGALYTNDQATVVNSTIRDNTARWGGGIYAAAELTVKESRVNGNEAKYNGGGIYAANGLDLRDSNILDNDARNAGGGIAIDEGAGHITRSTIANNTALRTAGIIVASHDPSINLTMNQSTISGNYTANSGVGVGLGILHGDAVIKNSTIVGNFGRNSTNTRYGSGISLGDGVHLTLSSSIVSGNGLKWGIATTNLPMADDIGQTVSGGVAYDIVGSHNMIGYSTVTTPPDTIDTIGPGMVGVGPTGLNALDDNGGFTLTHLPKPTSLAIDNGTDNGFSCDQRDDARSVGFAADIGSVEMQPGETADSIFANGFEAPPANCN